MHKGELGQHCRISAKRNSIEMRTKCPKNRNKDSIALIHLSDQNSVSQQSDHNIYLVYFSKQQKNSGILNLQIERVASAKKRMCNSCSLQNKFEEQVKVEPFNTGYNRSGDAFTDTTHSVPPPHPPKKKKVTETST